MAMNEAYAAYAALQGAQRDEQAVVPDFTIQCATGPRDDDGRLHGSDCRLVSVMGYTYRGACVHGQLAGDGTMCWRNGYRIAGVFDATTGTVSGRARLTWPNGDVYEGEVVHGIRHGTGTFTSASSVPPPQQVQGGQHARRHSVAHASARPSCRAATATFGTRRPRPQGACNDSAASGDDACRRRRLRCVAGGGGACAEVYVGEWQHGMRHGHGRQVYADGSVYDGEWRNGRRDGHGCLRYGNGDCYDGAWVRGAQHGRGVMGWRGASTWSLPQHDNSDGQQQQQRRRAHKTSVRHAAVPYTELYDGEWRDGLPDGEGIATYVSVVTPPRCANNGDDTHDDDDNCTTASASNDSDDDSHSDDGDDGDADDHVRPTQFVPPAHAVLNVYRGQFARGERDGRGVFYYADGSSYAGMWRRGQRCGRGVFTTAMGQACACDDGDVTSNTAAAAAAGGGGNSRAAAAALVPRVCVADVCRLADGSVAAAQASVAVLLLRYHTTLLGLFTRYAHACDDVAFVVTPPSWWRHRLPGHVTVAQLLRLLSDARVLDGVVCAATALSCIAAVLRHEHNDDDDVTPAEQQQPQRRHHRHHQHSNTHDHHDVNNSSGLRASLSTQLARLSRLDGELNYRQYAEVLVRLAPHVCVGACFATLGDQFAALVDAYLQPCYTAAANNKNNNNDNNKTMMLTGWLPSSRPLYTRSRACAAAGVLTPTLVQALTTQFAQLVQQDDDDDDSAAAAAAAAVDHDDDGNDSDAEGSRVAVTRPSSSSSSLLLLLSARHVMLLLTRVATTYALRVHDVLRTLLLPLLMPLHTLRDAAGGVDDHAEDSRSTSNNSSIATTTTTTAVVPAPPPLPSPPPRLPPGYNQPANPLSHELLVAGCGVDDTLLLAAMAVQQRLTLMDYVEVVVGVAALRAHRIGCALDTPLLHRVIDDVSDAAARVCDG